MAQTKRQYYAPDLDIFSLGQVLTEWFTNQKYQTQTVPYGNAGITVQARKEDTFRNLAGMSSALTISIYPEGENISVEMGNAKWLDKGAVAAVGALIFWPALVTAGIGAYQQNQLQTQAWQFIETTIRSNSAYGIPVAPSAGMPPMAATPPVTPSAGAVRPLGTAQPAGAPPPLDLSKLGGVTAGAAGSSSTCPQCKQVVRPGAKFCDNCGAPVAQKANVCSACGKPLRPGARFCDECGNPVR